MNFKSLFFLPLLLASCLSATKEIPSHPIDIKTKTTAVTLLGEHILSTPLYERDIAIAPKGNQIVYTLADYKQTMRCLVTTTLEDGKWSTPQILNISGTFHDIEPFFSDTGNRLYFASNRPIYNDQSRRDYNIWYSDRAHDGWADSIALDSTINTKGDEFFPSLSNKGHLYFTATRDNGVGKEDIYRSEYRNGVYQTPEALPTAINSPAFEFNAYISPNEDLIIFSSYGRQDDLGGGDLYMSLKDEKGEWKAAKNLGIQVNSDRLDYCPFVDWNTNILYFTSDRSLKDHKPIHHIDTLKNYSNSSLNGFGNLYKIGLDEVLKTYNQD
ncbi:exo-alpha-sialidase [Bizionia paragorgiae]|uniref:TolB family protein n=1 Tax=Bizionia paragorgiae TaxID=283786 RepID=UPI00299DC467|nr:exo-alpha-sialidase [Bizionia paragorgiae]MDX1271458.1 exo-alpha-sialidase [Bizionia paragorgiae]